MSGDGWRVVLAVVVFVAVLWNAVMQTILVRQIQIRKRTGL